MSALAVIRALPWRIIGPAIGALALVWLAGRWVEGERKEAFAKGAAAQKAADEAAYRAAQEEAEKAQRAHIARVQAADAAVARRTEDALRKELDDVRRTAADLRVRWASARADSGGAGQAGMPGAAGAAALAGDRACAAAGGLPHYVAVAALEDAEADAALVRAWQAWWAGLAAVERARVAAD